MKTITNNNMKCKECRYFEHSYYPILPIGAKYREKRCGKLDKELEKIDTHNCIHYKPTFWRKIYNKLNGDNYGH